MYFTDLFNERIRKVTVSTGIITTIVGSDDVNYRGDGIAAVNATVWWPYGVNVDSSGIPYDFPIPTTKFTSLFPVGNMYIADTAHYRVRKVTSGIISTVAGDGKPVSIGNGVPATSSSLVYPTRIGFDSSGTLHIIYIKFP